MPHTVLKKNALALPPCLLIPALSAPCQPKPEHTPLPLILQLDTSGLAIVLMDYLLDCEWVRVCISVTRVSTAAPESTPGEGKH